MQPALIPYNLQTILLNCSHKLPVGLRYLSQGASVRNYDVGIVGGGIVGCATARELLLKHPSLKVCILDKENRLGAHQSSNNSGVIHAGIYYAPGSLKAKLCVKGLDLMYKYCDENNVPYKRCGKLIVAANKEEVPRLNDLFKRATENGCRDLEMVDGSKIKDFEPYCRGEKALWSPHTGIVDYGDVTISFGESFKSMGGSVYLNFEVSDFQLNNENSSPGSSNEYPVNISSSKNENINCKYVITCGGLHADRLASKSGCSVDPKIVPFRGEYLSLKPEKRYLVRGNIYPVPDPRFPFLGFHFTPRMNGDIWLGPNAVLAFKREGYKFWDFNVKDLVESLTFKGMRTLMVKYFTFGVGEFYRRAFISAQIASLRRFIPDLRPQDVTRGSFGGVRAQALASDGSLVDDFVFDSGSGDLGSRILHVRNAPSPAATSSLAIAEMIVEEAQKKFDLKK